jgi:hypothetical protein
MPRTKAAPKRKLDDANIEPLIDIAGEVERVEVAGIRERIASGACRTLEPTSAAAADPDAPDGLVRLPALESADFDTFCALHATICSKLGHTLTGWGGIGDTSGRLRGYGYLPGQPAFAKQHFAESHAMKEYSGDEAERDRAANRRASILLDSSDVPDGFASALSRLLDALRPRLPPRYRRFASADQLVAAQPNLHRGKAYLKAHLDEPLNDGFGLLIVTLAVRGDAKILIRARPFEEDPAKRSEVCFDLARGQAYALSGDARNVCLHGVLAEGGSDERESLNLRFGLHTREKDDEFSAWREVERHWPDVDK